MTQIVRKWKFFLPVLVILLTGCVPDDELSPSMPTEVVQAVPRLHDTWVRPKDGMEMVFVPEGDLEMGSNKEEVDFALGLCEQHPDSYGKCASEDFQDETPQHTVPLESFWIDRTEVTNTQYSLCVEAGFCNPSRLANNETYNGGDYPVAGIPWDDAVAYCSWAGGRLPSEAEWEFAARGPEGSLFPWGDNFECGRGSFGEACTPCDDGYEAPSPVASFPEGVSWCGAMDLAGNVWEWVAVNFGEYPLGDSSDSSTSASGNLKILRGGSWGYCPAFVRSAYRYPVPSTADYLAVGFRCVLQNVE